MTRFENDTWVPVGPAVPSGDSVAGRGGAGGVSNSAALSVEPSLAPSGSGVLWMAWRDTLDHQRHLRASLERNGYLGRGHPRSASGGGIAGPSNHTVPQVRLDANDLPIVAWQNFASGQGVVFILRVRRDGLGGDGAGLGHWRRHHRARRVPHGPGVSSGPGPRTVNVAWHSSMNNNPPQARLRAVLQRAELPAQRWHQSDRRRTYRQRAHRASTALASPAASSIRTVRS